MPFEANAYMGYEGYNKKNDFLHKASDVKDLFDRPYIYRKNKKSDLGSSSNLLINKKRDKDGGSSYKLYKKPYISPNDQNAANREYKKLQNKDYSSLSNEEKRKFQDLQRKKIMQENQKELDKKRMKAKKERQLKDFIKRKESKRKKGEKKKYFFKNRTVKYRKQYDYDVNDVAPRLINRK